MDGFLDVIKRDPQEKQKISQTSIIDYHTITNLK